MSDTLTAPELLAPVSLQPATPFPEDFLRSEGTAATVTSGDGSTTAGDTGPVSTLGSSIPVGADLAEAAPLDPAPDTGISFPGAAAATAPAAAAAGVPTGGDPAVEADAPPAVQPPVAAPLPEPTAVVAGDTALSVSSTSARGPPVSSLISAIPVDAVLLTAAAGGTMRSGGATLVFAPGALPVDAYIVIRPSATTPGAFDLHAYDAASGAEFHTFNRAPELSLPLADGFSTGSVVYLAPDGSTELIASRVDPVSGTVTASLAHFSTYTVSSTFVATLIVDDPPVTVTPAGGVPETFRTIIVKVVGTNLTVTVNGGTPYLMPIGPSITGVVIRTAAQSEAIAPDVDDVFIVDLSGGALPVAVSFDGGSGLDEVRVVGAKNSALKLMAAALLAVGESVLVNVPDIVDVSVRDDGMNLHAVSMFTPDTGTSLGSGPLIISMPEHRATVDVVTELSGALIRHAGDTEVRLKLVKGDVARMFEIPYPVSVTADLYGELKSLLGPNCLT